MSSSNSDRSSDGSSDGYMRKTGGSERRRVKVLLADDHTMFREGLANMMASSYGDEVEVVGKTDTGQAAVAQAH